MVAPINALPSPVAAGGGFLLTYGRAIRKRLLHFLVCACGRAIRLSKYGRAGSALGLDLQKIVDGASHEACEVNHFRKHPRSLAAQLVVQAATTDVDGVSNGIFGNAMLGNVGFDARSNLVNHSFHLPSNVRNFGHN